MPITSSVLARRVMVRLSNGRAAPARKVPDCALPLIQLSQVPKGGRSIGVLGWRASAGRGGGSKATTPRLPGVSDSVVLGVPDGARTRNICITVQCSAIKLQAPYCSRVGREFCHPRQRARFYHGLAGGAR